MEEIRYSTPDGERSYANCLLTALAKGRGSRVEIISGQPLPDLSDLQLSETRDLHWINTLPFKYENLDADLVIGIILRAAGRRWFQIWKSSLAFHAALATSSDELKSIAFWLTLKKSNRGARVLRIEKLTRD